MAFPQSAVRSPQGLGHAGDGHKSDPVSVGRGLDQLQRRKGAVDLERNNLGADGRRYCEQDGDRQRGRPETD